MYKCQPLLNLFLSQQKDQIRFWQESQCGDEKELHVCCGTLDNYRNSPPKQSESTNKLPGTSTRPNNSYIPRRSSCEFQVIKQIFVLNTV